MASKLKELEITKVDFVDNGANPNAHIKLFKNKNGELGTAQEVPTESGEPKQNGMFKRFISVIGKAVGLKPEEIDATIEEIAKGNEAETFGEKMYEVKRRKIVDEMWDLCYALQSSLCSIICDDEAGDNTLNLMKTSLDEFTTVMNGAIEQWSEGKESNVIKKSSEPVDPAELEYMKSYRDHIDTMIAKAEKDKGNGTRKEIEKLKGEKEEMKIDKSKLTPAERAFLEDIEKRCGDGTSTEVTPQEDPVAKNIQTPGQATEPAVAASEPEDIYKGLHPAVKAELEALTKRAAAAEEKELADIAKKYEIIGKKPEELVPVLKSLKTSSVDAYDNMIAILDASVEAVNKSSMFGEVGKSGGYSNAESDAWSKIEKKADEIMQANPAMNRSVAIDTVCQQNPQLVREYESEE